MSVYRLAISNSDLLSEGWERALWSYSRMIDAARLEGDAFVAMAREFGEKASFDSVPVKLYLSTFRSTAEAQSYLDGFPASVSPNKVLTLVMPTRNFCWKIAGAHLPELRDPEALAARIRALNSIRAPK